MKHRKLYGFFSLILAVFVSAASIRINAFASDKVSAIWDGSIASGFADGDGTEEDPYMIETAEQLAYLASSVNAGNSYSGKFIKLAKSIALNDTVNFDDWGRYISEERLITANNIWTPIGTLQAPFNGTFDGGGFTVSGVFVCSVDGVNGVFGGVYNGGTVKNLTVDKSYIKSDNSSNKGAAGGIVAINDGTIADCRYSGAVIANMGAGGITGINRGIVKNCYCAGKIYGDQNTGGIVGLNGGLTNNCSASGLVVGGTVCGGIAGINNGTLVFCFNKGSVIGQSGVGGVCGDNIGSVGGCYNGGSVYGTNDIIGGIIALNDYKVTNSYNTGRVEGHAGVGGIVGINSGEENIPEITKCYNIGEIKAAFDYGGIMGYDLKGKSTVSDCCYGSGSVGSEHSQYGTEVPNRDLCKKSIFAGWDFDNVWNIDASVNNGYPFLRGIVICDHSYAPAVTEPTENNIGYTVYECSLCHHKYIGDIVFPKVTVAGDLDGVEGVSADDAIYLLYVVFFPEDYPVSQSCDFDGNGVTNADDAIYLLYHVFFPSDYPIS